jgi:outer membrane protein TolC
VFSARVVFSLVLRQFRKRSVAAATDMLKRAENTYQAESFSIDQLFDAYQTIWDARLQELELERQSADSEAALERATVLVPFKASQLQ